mgnify:CR=1 FL=1
MKKKKKVNDLITQEILESFIIHELNELKKKNTLVPYYKENPILIKDNKISEENNKEDVIVIKL